MSNMSVRFCNTRLIGTGKKGILPVDANGYRTVIVGGLGILNSQGQYYTSDGARDLFNKSSSLIRRVERGSLKAENGHPKMERGMSTDEYISRMMNIDERNICGHFSEFWLDENSVKQKDGKSVIAIMAKVIPSGAKADILERAFTNPFENSCFSVRGLTNDYMNRGQIVRELRQIVTFDYVNEPGIAIAEKYNSPTMECFDEVSVTKNEFLRAVENSKNTALATESSIELAGQLFESLGWSLPKSIIPAYVKW